MTIFKKILIYFLVAFLLMMSVIITAFLSSFSTKYIALTKQISIDYQTNFSLILAIMKTESKFDSNAKSSKNAIGLMQIKIETANYMQEKYAEPSLSEKDLFVPEKNIICGVRYFKYLKDKFENEDAAICAYNAGETIVRTWLSNSQYSNDGKTLKSIPYAETRNYLKKVKFNKSIYEKLLK